MKKHTVRVYHGYYGCDTGCCGHILELDYETVGQFDFMHSYEGLTREEVIEAAKAEIAKHKPECLDSIDWESLEINVEGC